MGVFINLHIIPGRIDPEDWRAVYRETLTLIQAFPFLSRVRGEDGFPYAVRTVETKDLADGCAGWYVDGDMRSGSNMESFQLVEDIQYYRQRENDGDNGYDILLDGLYDLEIEHPRCSINIWGNKTQGEPAHIFLLAIACLICDRFPHAAFVDGDISAGQCYQATQWANQFLTSPIGMPVTADIERLLLRLKNAGLTEQQRLEAFFELALTGKDADLGDCLKDSFSPQDLSAYYREKLKPLHRKEGQLYLNGAALKEYLALELDFRQLCWLVMADPEGNRLTPEEFMGELLRRKLHIEEKETTDYTSFLRDSASVETVGSMLTRAFLMLHGGHNINVDTYIPLPDICEGFRAALGQDFDAEGLAESILREGIEPDEESTQAFLYDDPNSDFRKRIAQLRAQAQENAAYDIASYDDLMDFRRLKDGRYTTVTPSLDERLTENVRTIRGFADSAWPEFSKLDRTGREQWFQDYYHTLIPLELHEKMLQHIMDDPFIRKYVGVYRVKCDSDIARKLVHSLLWNETLLDYYWEKAGAEE